MVYLKNGKRTSITTKSTTKKAAYKFLLEFKEHLQQRKSIPKKSISDFRKEYEKYISETKSKNYLRSVKLSFNQFIDFTGEIDLNDISIRLVEKFIQNTYSRANYAAALYYRTLKAALSSALRWNYMDNNPFDQIKVPKQISKHPLFISRSELDTIRESIKNSQIRNMMLISYDAGLRLSEVINLRLSNIDLQHKILTVSNDSIFQTKNKKDRIIPLTNRLYNIFLRKAPNIFKVPTNNELVFSNKSGLIYNADYVSRTFKKVIRELKFNEPGY